MSAPSSTPYPKPVKPLTPLDRLALGNTPRPLPLPVDAATLAAHYKSLVHGWGVGTFPVAFVEDANGKLKKLPQIKAWEQLTAKDGKTPALNWGMTLPRNWLVVDVDVSAPDDAPNEENPKQKRRHGLESWLRLLALLPAPLPKTQLVIQTPSGGYHYFFRKDPNFPIRKNVKEYPGIDFLSAGSYLVGAGSQRSPEHPCYAPIQGDCPLAAVEDTKLFNEAFPEVPKQWLALLNKTSISQYTVNYEVKDTQDVIDAFTLYAKHCPHAVQGAGGDNTTFQTACKARDLGLSPEKAFQIMGEHFNPRCEPPWEAHELELKIHNAYEYGSGGIGSHNYANYLEPLTPQAEKDKDASAAADGVRWVHTASGMLAKNNEDNAINLIVTKPYGEYENALYNIFRFNELTERIEYALAPPWYCHTDDYKRAAKGGVLEFSESEIKNMRRYFSQVLHYDVDGRVLYQAVQYVAKRMPYHPIRSWLKSLVWDKVSRLDSWLVKYLGVDDTELSSAQGRLWLLGACNRILNPGTKWDYVPVLEGEQGTLKSTVCRILAVNPRWFASVPPDTDKDTRRILSQKWIVELAEIDDMNKRTPSALKAFITTEIDTMRAPYAILHEDYFRQSVCIGTINPKGDSRYLNDPTGARRFWPFRVNEVDIEGLRKAMPQLYAEAMHLLQTENPPLYLSEELENMAKRTTSRRQTTDAFTDLLYPWLKEKAETQATVNLFEAYQAAVGGSLNHYTNIPRIRSRLVDAVTTLGYPIKGESGDTIVLRESLPEMLAIVDEMEGLEELLGKAPTVTPSYNYGEKELQLSTIRSGFSLRLTKFQHTINEAHAFKLGGLVAVLFPDCLTGLDVYTTQFIGKLLRKAENITFIRKKINGEALRLYGVHPLPKPTGEEWCFLLPESQEAVKLHNYPAAFAPAYARVESKDVAGKPTHWLDEVEL